jgi:hypothetical protein
MIGRICCPGLGVVGRVLHDICLQAQPHQAGAPAVSSRNFITAEFALHG